MQKLDGAVHVCPSDQTWNQIENYSETSYLAVVGDNTMWPGADSRSLKDVSGQTASIIMLVEVADSGIDFFEPRDLFFNELSFPLNDPDGPYPVSQHQSKTTWPWQTPDLWVHVAMVDGSVKSLPVSTCLEAFRAMLTVDDP
ncbi:MAG: hypothetical protein KDA52_05730 [Planctomycetaceae bacterium]|nr:hypothetical protein [Planctomycetaceae bacterium]